MINCLFSRVYASKVMLFHASYNVATHHRPTQTRRWKRMKKKYTKRKLKNVSYFVNDNTCSGILPVLPGIWLKTCSDRIYSFRAVFSRDGAFTSTIENDASKDNLNLPDRPTTGYVPAHIHEIGISHSTTKTKIQKSKIMKLLR